MSDAIRKIQEVSEHMDGFMEAVQDLKHYPIFQNSYQAARNGGLSPFDAAMVAMTDLAKAHVQETQALHERAKVLAECGEAKDIVREAEALLEQAEARSEMIGAWITQWTHEMLKVKVGGVINQLLEEIPTIEGLDHSQAACYIAGIMQVLGDTRLSSVSFWEAYDFALVETSLSLGRLRPYLALREAALNALPFSLEEEMLYMSLDPLTPIAHPAKALGH